MFDNNIRVEPIPERVFELCCLVNKKTNKESECRHFMEPDSLNSSSTVYFSIIRDTAVELKLIEKNGDSLTFAADKGVIKDLDSFRYYCNSIVWKNENSYFYKIAKCFLDADDGWFQYQTITDLKITSEVREKTGISNVQSVFMLGMRFWLSFLGFGYVQESGNSITFLPNMYIALKDFITIAKLETGQEYPVSDFIDRLSSVSKVAFGGCVAKQRMNLALSNALRQLHDKKEIELKRNYDSKEVWNMFPNPSHKFTSEITHIFYKGVKS